MQVKTLGLKGGTDIRESVWRIMPAMITNSLAKNINMRGVNGKIGFWRLQIRDVVCGKYTLMKIHGFNFYDLIQ